MAVGRGRRVQNRWRNRIYTRIMRRILSVGCMLEVFVVIDPGMRNEFVGIKDKKNPATVHPNFWARIEPRSGSDDAEDIGASTSVRYSVYFLANDVPTGVFDTPLHYRITSTRRGAEKLNVESAYVSEDRSTGMVICSG